MLGPDEDFPGFAGSIGVPYPTVIKWFQPMRGSKKTQRHLPSIRALARMAEAGYPVRWLLTGKK
jgi:hypothetical protein